MRKRGPGRNGRRTCSSPLARLGASRGAKRRERSLRGPCFSAEGGAGASWIRANADRPFGRPAAARRPGCRMTPSVTEQQSRRPSPDCSFRRGGATLGPACDGRPRPAFVVVRASRRRLYGPWLARGTRDSGPRGGPRGSERRSQRPQADPLLDAISGDTRHRGGLLGEPRVPRVAGRSVVCRGRCPVVRERRLRRHRWAGASAPRRRLSVVTLSIARPLLASNLVRW
jgi:hypothetical protein